MEVVPLRDEHDRTRFSSGEAPLDEFLQRYAGVNEGKISRTYVATEQPDPTVLGYVTILAGAVTCENLPEAERRGLPRYPLPVLHIGRLAVDKRAQGKGLGRTLLMHALDTAISLADQLGIWGVEVYAKNERARNFYEKYGFRSLTDDSFHMYISLRTVRKAFE